MENAGTKGDEKIDEMLLKLEKDLAAGRDRDKKSRAAFKPDKPGKPEKPGEPGEDITGIFSYRKLLGPKEEEEGEEGEGAEEKKKEKGKKKAAAAKEKEEGELDEETRRAIIERIKHIIAMRGNSRREELRRLLTSTPGGFHGAITEILRSYAHVLRHEEIPMEGPKKIEGSAITFRAYSEKEGGKKGLYDEKPEIMLYSERKGEKSREETYRQTKAADMDAEKAMKKMAGYRDEEEGKKKKLSPYSV